MAESMVTIRRQVLEVEMAGTQADGLALQRRLPAVCADLLSPALAAELARIDPGDAHLYVERLPVNVAGVALDRLEAELVAAVVREVAAFFRRHPPAAPGHDAGPGTTAVERRTPAATVDDALVVFLRSGRLPWSFRVPPGARLEQLVQAAWRAAGGGVPRATRARLAQVLAAEDARTRLLLQFTADFVRGLVRAWSPGVAAVAAAIQARTSAPPVFQREVWSAALDVAVRQAASPSAAATASRPPGHADLARTAWGRLTAAERADPALALRLEAYWPGVTQRRAAAARATPTRPLPPVDEVDGAADGILVDNAGVVLLHPFLPRFLGALGIADDDALVDPARALCLLHHLATGERSAPEHRLTVAKVLCDVPLDQPVAADVGLTAIETTEADALLAAAIQHWGALRGSSPDAVRGEFLMRPATLTADVDDGWLLRIESRTVDILLDQLPWSTSMIKLPWMSRLLRVEWG
jgi:hypothetical protein